MSMPGKDNDEMVSTKHEDSALLNSGLASSAGASLLVLTQIFTKLATFSLNQLLVQYVTPTVLGTASYWEFVVQTILFFSREAERLAVQRADSDVAANCAEALKIYLAKYREQQAIKQERGETRVSRKHSKSSLQIPVDTGETAVTESPINDDMIQPYENGQEQYESGGDQDQENSEEHTFFYGDREKLKEELEDHQIPLQEVTKHDDYQYHDFISDPNEEPLNENHNIDELTKQLTNEDSEIDTLAGDTNYF